MVVNWALTALAMGCREGVSPPASPRPVKGEDPSFDYEDGIM